jgi:hypothetical protein
MGSSDDSGTHLVDGISTASTSRTGQLIATFATLLPTLIPIFRGILSRKKRDKVLPK